MEGLLRKIIDVKIIAVVGTLLVSNYIKAQDTLFFKNGSFLSCHVLLEKSDRFYYKILIDKNKTQRKVALKDSVKRFANHPSKDLFYNIKTKGGGIRIFADITLNTHYYKQPNSYGKNPWNGKGGLTIGYNNIYLNCEYGQVRDHRTTGLFSDSRFKNNDIVQEINYDYSLGYGYDISPYLGFTQKL